MPTKQPAYITIEQLNRLVRNIEEKDIQDIVIVAFYTGMRLSEVLNLKWNAVDIDRAVLTVYSHLQKNALAKAINILLQKTNHIHHSLFSLILLQY